MLLLRRGKFEELSKLPFPDRFRLIIDSNVLSSVRIESSSFFFFFLMITVNLNRFTVNLISWITSWEIELKQWSNRRKHDLKNVFWGYKKIREFVNYLSREKYYAIRVYNIIFYIWIIFFFQNIVYLCSKLVKKTQRKKIICNLILYFI